MNSSPSLTAALPFSWQLSWPFSCLRSHVEPLTDSFFANLFEDFLAAFLTLFFGAFVALAIVFVAFLTGLGNRLFRFFVAP